jgi:hypothetical protein
MDLIPRIVSFEPTGMNVGSIPRVRNLLLVGWGVDVVERGECVLVRKTMVGGDLLRVWVRASSAAAKDHEAESEAKHWLSTAEGEEFDRHVLLGA